jgi:hypothetical protein
MAVRLPGSARPREIGASSRKIGLGNKELAGYLIRGRLTPLFQPRTAVTVRLEHEAAHPLGVGRFLCSSGPDNHLPLLRSDHLAKFAATVVLLAGDGAANHVGQLQKA